MTFVPLLAGGESAPSSLSPLSWQALLGSDPGKLHKGTAAGIVATARVRRVGSGVRAPGATAPLPCSEQVLSHSGLGFLPLLSSLVLSSPRHGNLLLVPGKLV